MKLQKKSLKYLLKVILCYHVSIPSPSIFHVISVLLKMRPDHKGRKWRRTKEPLDESERGEWKSLKLNIQKTKIMASGPIISWQIDGETVETVSDLILGGFKITADGDMKLKDTCS